MDGRLARTLPFEPTGDPIFALGLYRLAGFLGEDYVLMASSFPADMRPAPIAYWDAGSTFLYSSDGKRKATIAEPAGMDTYSTPQRAGAVIFGRWSSGVVTGQKIMMTDGGDAEYRVYNRPGAPIQRVRWAHTRIPVDRQMVNQFRQLRADPTGMAEWGAADYYPSISNMLTDPDGYIWVEQWKLKPSDASTWHVFDDKGEWLGSVTLPTHFRAKAVTTHSVAGVLQDANTGVQTVRVYPLYRGRNKGRP
jgi:hypothetical protein